MCWLVCSALVSHGAVPEVRPAGHSVLGPRVRARPSQRGFLERDEGVGALAPMPFNCRLTLFRVEPEPEHMGQFISGMGEGQVRHGPEAQSHLLAVPPERLAGAQPEGSSRPAPVVDPEYRPLGHQPRERAVQLDSGVQIFAERLLEDNPAALRQPPPRAAQRARATGNAR